MDAMTFLKKLEPIQKKLYQLNMQKVKRILAAAVASVILLCVILGGNKKLAKSIDLSDMIQQPEHAVQDPRAWGQGSVSMSDEPLQMGGYRIYYYKLDMEALEAYIAMLEQNGFTLVGEYHQSSFLGSYQSYGLICDEASDVETRDLMYADVPCPVNIWLSSSQWRVEICDGLEMVDLGLRRDGSQGSNTPQGESVEAGLSGKPGKRYKTTDGRMKVKSGNAYILLEDEEITREVSWSRSGSKVTLTIEINDDLTAQIMYREDELEQGDVLLLGSPEEHFATFKLTADKKSISATQTGTASFENVTLRVMYLEEKGNVVLYLHVQPLDTETYPSQMEIFCAVDTTPEEKESSGGSDGGGWWSNGNDFFQPEFSKLDCLTCGGDGDCNTCGGYGEVERYAGGGDTVTSKCSSCYGSGDCRTCGGSGKR